MIYNDLKEANFSEQRIGNHEGMEANTSLRRADESVEGVKLTMTETAGASLVDIVVKEPEVAKNPKDGQNRESPNGPDGNTNLRIA